MTQNHRFCLSEILTLKMNHNFLFVNFLKLKIKTWSFTDNLFFKCSKLAEQKANVPEIPCALSAVSLEMHSETSSNRFLSQLLS